VTLDPGFAAAWVSLGWGYWSLVYSGWTDTPDEAKRKALDAAQQAIAADGFLGDPHALLADIASTEGDNARALHEAELAAKLNPNNADGLAMLAVMLADGPRSGEAVEQIRRAMRLNPIPPAWYYNVLGQAYLTEDRHDEAVAALRACTETAPDFVTCHRYLTAAYLEADRLNEARSEAREVLRINPGYSIAQDETWVKSTEDIAERQRRIELLRKAGLPE
jgi:tetratricopeptide (TPR) repeat protein